MIRNHLFVAAVVCFGFPIAQLTAIEETHFGSSLPNDDGRLPNSESDAASNAKDRTLLRSIYGGHRWYHKSSGATTSVFSTETEAQGQASRNDDSNNNKFMTAYHHIQEKAETNRANHVFTTLERNKKENAAASSENSGKRGKGKGSSSKRSSNSGKGKGKGSSSSSSKRGSKSSSKSKSSKSSKDTDVDAPFPIQTRRVPNIFLSYVLPVTQRTTPSDADYAELAEATTDWFEQAVKESVPPFMFLLTVEYELDYAEYGAGMPEPRYNVLLVFEYVEYTYYVTNDTSDNAPSAAMINQIMTNSITAEYIIEVVRKIPAFADVNEVFYEAQDNTFEPIPTPSFSPSPFPISPTPSPVPVDEPTFEPSFIATATPSPAPSSTVPSSFGPSSLTPSFVGSPTGTPSSLLPSFSGVPSALATSDVPVPLCSFLADGPFTFALETSTVYTENLAPEDKKAILEATEAFLLANINFPDNSYELQYVDDFLAEPPVLDPASTKIEIGFTAGVSLKCGADSTQAIPPFFEEALESDAFLQALAPVLAGTPAEPTTSVTVVTPPFLDGFGRL